MPTLADSVIGDLQRPLEHERHRAYREALKAGKSATKAAGKTAWALTVPGAISLASALKRGGLWMAMAVPGRFGRETIIIGGPTDPESDLRRRELLAFCRGRKIHTKELEPDEKGSFKIEIDAAHSDEVHEFLKSRETPFASLAGATIVLEGPQAEAHGRELTAFCEGLGIDANVRGLDEFGLFKVDMDAKDAKKVEKFLTKSGITFASTARREDEERFFIPFEEARTDGELGRVDYVTPISMNSPEEAESAAATLTELGFWADVHKNKLFFRGEEAARAYAKIKEGVPEVAEKSPDLEQIAGMNAREAPTPGQIKYARSLGMSDKEIKLATTRDAMTLLLNKHPDAYSRDLTPEREQAAREAIEEARASMNDPDNPAGPGDPNPPDEPPGGGGPAGPALVPPSSRPPQGKDLFERAQEAARNEDLGQTREHPQDVQAQPPAHDSDPSTPWPDGADAPGSGDIDHDGIQDSAEDIDGDGIPNDMEPAPCALDDSLDARCENAVQCASTDRAERADPEIGDPDEVR